MQKIKNYLQGKKIKDIFYYMTKYTIAIYALMAIVFFGAHENCIKMNNLLADNLRYVEAIEQMQHASTDLTRNSRRFVVVGDKQALQLYYDEVMDTNNRYKSVQILEDIEQEEYSHIRSAWQSSMVLTHVEIYAMKLAASARGYNLDMQLDMMYPTQLTEQDLALDREERLQKAITMIYDAEYEQQKTLIDTYLNSAMSTLQAVVAEERGSMTSYYKLLIASLYVSLIVLLVSNMASLWGSRKLIAEPVEKFVKSIARGCPCPQEGCAEMQILAQAYNEQYYTNKEREKELSRQAYYDELTGALNRRVFAEMLTNVESTGNGGLMIIDVDKFKGINDTYGHATGDLVLRRVASLLRVYFRGSNIHVARFGGDEFAVMLGNVPEKLDGMKKRILRTGKIINRILQANWDGSIPKTSLSIGVAFLSDIQAAGEERSLLECADMALYQVKTNGRKGIRIWEEGNDEQAGDI